MKNIRIKPPKSAKTMGFAALAIAAAFYFFPDFAIIDIFPDIIAYVLICFGLSKISYLNESVDDARKLFSRMIIVSACKFVAIIITFSATNAEEQASLMLLMVFVTSLLECLILIPAYINLFDGILYLGMRHDGSAVFGKKYDRFKKSRTDKIKTATIVFVIVKNLSVVLPETAALSTTDSIYSYKLGMYEFIPLFRGFGMMISLVFGIIWLCRIVSYFRALTKDKPFCEALCNRYNAEILPNTEIFAERKIGLACLFFAIGAALAVDFYIDGNNGYNIIPDALMAISVFFGLLMLKKYISNLLFTLGSAACGAYGLISVINWNLMSDFSYRYTAAQVRTNASAARAWRMLVGMSVAEAILFFALVAILLIVCTVIVKNHTGYSFEHTTIDPTVKIGELHKSLKARLYIVGALGFLAGAGGVFRVIMFRYATLLADMSWVVEAVLTLAFFVMFAIVLWRINEEVKEKYLYR